MQDSRNPPNEKSGRRNFLRKRDRARIKGHKRLQASRRQKHALDLVPTTCAGAGLATWSRETARLNAVLGLNCLASATSTAALSDASRAAMSIFKSPGLSDHLWQPMTSSLSINQLCVVQEELDCINSNRHPEVRSRRRLRVLWRASKDGCTHALEHILRRREDAAPQDVWPKD